MGGTSLSGELHNVLGEGDCHLSIHYVMEQCQSCTGPPVFQCFPPKAVYSSMEVTLEVGEKSFMVHLAARR